MLRSAFNRAPPLAPMPQNPPSHRPGRRWFVVNTQPSSELRACENLMRQGWETYHPRLPRTIRSGRRTVTELRPLFPGYVFVSLDLQKDAWRSVDGTFGVRSLVKSGETPSPLPSGIVEALRESSDAQGRVVFSHALNVGDKVRFLAGPFADLIGSLEQLNPNGRVTVLLNLLGRETEVRARAQDLFPIR